MFAVSFERCIAVPTTKNEDEYCFCYDYGWLARENNKYYGGERNR